MDNLVIKYTSYAKMLPPRPIRITSGGWAGPPVKMEDGSDPQPWHCLPFVEGSTYGLELIYPYENECHVVNDKGTVRFEWDFAGEPGGYLTGAEFVLFSPVLESKYYLFNTRLDLQTPPGYVIRTEPHPRYFTDDTGTVPLSMIGHLQNEWYPRMVFVVFRAPRPGQRHIFRKGEPFAQLLFVHGRVTYEITEMGPEEAAQRRQLEQAIQMARSEIAENAWRNADGLPQNNHYKVLARAYARAGMNGIDELVQDAVKRHELTFPKNKTIAESLGQGLQLVTEHKYDLAHEVYSHVLSEDPNNAEALCHLGVCYVCRGNPIMGLTLMRHAVTLEPHVPRYHSSLGELLRRLGQLEEAESSIRLAVSLSPHDAGILGVLGLILAQQGRTTEALLAYRQAAALGCPYPRTHVQMGLVLAEQGHYAEARVCYEAALRLEPDFAAAQRALHDLPVNIAP